MSIVCCGDVGVIEEYADGIYRIYKNVWLQRRPMIVVILLPNDKTNRTDHIISQQNLDSSYNQVYESSIDKYTTI